MQVELLGNQSILIVGCYQIKIGIIIPARLDSTRLPNKVLRLFSGKPMIQHVWERAKLVNPNLDIVIATNSKLIKSTCETFSATTILTKQLHENGLSRIGEAAKFLDWDYFIVLQADEIFIKPSDLSKLAKAIEENQDYHFYNLVTNLTRISDLNDTNVVKCTMRANNTIINMFRINGFISPKKTQLKFTSKVCGVFALSKILLEELILQKSTIIQKNESIEQMKIIEMGHEIFGVRIKSNYDSINTHADAQRAVEIFKRDKTQRKYIRGLAEN